MKKQLLTLVILLTSITTFAQFQDTACRKLDVDHGIHKLGHDYHTQLNNLRNIGFEVYTVDEEYMPVYSQATMDSFADEPYYKLLQILGYGGPYITATNVLTLPVDFNELSDYTELIDKLSRLSPEMEAFESYEEVVTPEGDKILKFKAEGQVFEWKMRLDYVYFDERFMSMFQEVVINYTNSDKGQLCWFLSMDDEHLVFMWLTPAQMLYMNETLHLHRIIFM